MLSGYAYGSRPLVGCVLFSGTTISREGPNGFVLRLRLGISSFELMEDTS